METQKAEVVICPQCLAHVCRCPFEIICDSSDRTAWLKARKDGVGASEIAIVMGESSWDSALGLFALKTGKRPEEELDGEWIFWGTKLEPVIIDVFGSRANRTVQQAGILLRSKEHPWAMCTLDAWCADETDERCGPWPLEVKNGSEWVAGEWAEGPPMKYYYQLQHQMLVTGAHRSTIACLLGGNRLVWADVDRDEVCIRRMIKRGREFWDMVQSNTAPEPDGTAHSSEALLKLYPNAVEGHVFLDADMLEQFDELTDIKGSIKALTSRKGEIEQAMKAKLGDKTQGIFPNLASVTWKDRRGSIDWKAYAVDLGGDDVGGEEFRRGNSRTLRQQQPKTEG